MVCGCGAVQPPRCAEKRLLGVLLQVCPVTGQEFSSLISGRADILSIVDVLALLYAFQNRVIHGLARKQDPSLLMSFADRELLWIGQDGPAKFFTRIEQALRKHCPDVFDQEKFHEAWNYFQILLTGEHIAYMTRILGYVPGPEEYLNHAWMMWCERIAERFSPLRPLPTLH